MHLVTLRLERVYDVHIDPFSRNLTRTLFSFDSNGRKYLSVSVEGAPQLAPDQTITFALRQADNWQTVCGMLVHETGELCVSSASLQVWLMLLTVFCAVISFMALKFDHPKFVAPTMAGFILVIAALAYGAYKSIRLKNLLLQSR